jgi:acetyl/propionyl-CoA carboxylase alpha subunit
MLNVAAGKKLSERLLQTGPHLPFHGHAIEARVYAENPLRNFLPSIGPLIRYREPVTNYDYNPGAHIEEMKQASGAATGESSGDAADTHALVRVDSGVCTTVRCIVHTQLEFHEFTQSRSDANALRCSYSNTDR